MRLVERVRARGAQARGQERIGEDTIEDAQPRLVHEADAAVALAALHPGLAERLVEAGPAHAAECETQEEIPVLVHLDRFVESAGLDDGCATKHHRDRMREIAEEEATADVPLLARPSLVREPDAVAVD